MTNNLETTILDGVKEMPEFDNEAVPRGFVCSQHSDLMTEIATVSTRAALMEKTNDRDHAEIKEAINKLSDNIIAYSQQTLTRNGETRTNVAVLSERIKQVVRINLLWGGSAIVILCAITGNAHAIAPLLKSLFGTG